MTGTVYPPRGTSPWDDVLKAYLDDTIPTSTDIAEMVESGPLREALSDSFAASFGRLFQPVDAAKIVGRLRAGLGVSYAAVGDSLQVGYDGSGGVYGETRGIATMSVPVVLCLALANTDPNFVPPDPTVAT